MFPKSVLITGSNRGIGLGLVKELLKISEIETIIAGARNPEAAKDLQSLSKDNSRLHLLQIDVSDDNSLKNSVRKVEDFVGARGLNMLINNGGVLDAYRADGSPNKDIVMRTFEVNACGALLASQYFLPLLQKASVDSPGSDLSPGRACILNIGSDCSSQELNVNGFNDKIHLAYKMSKAAMLSFARSLVADFQNLDIKVLVTTIHPGWVITDMGGPDADITVEESTSAIVKSIGKLNESHNGGLFDRHLKEIPF
ncbi:unnamed protein product [Caenorhabditis brenneri]